MAASSFQTYNKVLPGVYVNYVSVQSATATVSERGVAAVAMPLSWGPEGEFQTVTAEEFMTNSQKYFGYSYTSRNLRALKDLFLNATTAHVFRLGTGKKASCTYAEAKYGGVCGNSITIRIATSIDTSTCFDVSTYFDGKKKDTQTVSDMSELTDNDYVTWKKTATLAATAGTVLTGGTDATVTGDDYQAFLDAAESVSFNALGVASTDKSVNALVASYTKRMREERGVKFQTVLYNYAADDIGVINVMTPVYESGMEAQLVWFVTGASAACGLNESLINKKYDGFFPIARAYTQTELESLIKAGGFIFRRSGDDYRVVSDINSMVSSGDLEEAFKENQTVRIIDQIAIDDAELFRDKYLGIVPNDEAGRLSLWNDIVKERKTLEKMRAIENFSDEDVEVVRGDTKNAVIVKNKICPVNAMAFLYITTTVE